MDGAHSGGDPHFFFLPPMMLQPRYSGVFESRFSPVVRICEWTGTECRTPLVATLARIRGFISSGAVQTHDRKHYLEDNQYDYRSLHC